MKNRLENIVFGGGCFWCTEAVFSRVKGVVKVICGYAGGKTKNPDYDKVSKGNTGHAEVIMIKYNPKIISFEEILDIFFIMHDPTSLNRQGGDIGSQYRSIILYISEDQKRKAELFIKRIQSNFNKLIVTEIKKLEKFYPAESYHQEYYEKNPNQPYCRLVISPKIKRLTNKLLK